MHVGTAAEKSKSVAMYFPATLKEAQEQNKIKSLLPDIKLNNNTNLIQFFQDFKYLGSIISKDLKEVTEIKARIKKAWSIGAMKFVLKNKDVDLNTKSSSTPPPRCKHFYGEQNHGAYPKPTLTR